MAKRRSALYEVLSDERRLNKAQSGDEGLARAGKSFRTVRRGDGLIGHEYVAGDPDSVVWLKRGQVGGSKREQAQRAVQDRGGAPVARSALEELLAQLRGDSSRFRGL